ncbi:MAG: PAS domain S-box protein [Coprothermobacterota bacterium]|nr:PAS domain S-box protein [Coprothermobacterota bacterium]
MPDLRKTILLVENDAEYGLHVAEHIKVGGFNVVTADNGETAIGIVEKGPEVDLVIMGLDLGNGKDGLQAADKILRGRDLPLLFLASRLEPETIDKTEKLSHYGLILKSVGDAVLLSSIKMAFRLHSTHVEVKIREQLLRESEEKFSKSFHLTPLSMAISLASDRRYIEINDAFLTLTGYSREEVIGRNSLELGLWMDAETKTHVNHEIATIGEAHNVPIQLRTKSGQIRDATYSAAVVSLGGAPHVVAQVLDITDRKRAEQALREREEGFQNLFENSTIGLYRTTPDGRILLANPELRKMLGFPTFEELARRNLEEGDLPTEYSRQTFRQEIEERGEIRGLESAWERRDGTILFVRESAHTVRDAEGRILFYEGTVEDITERKKSEEALRTAEANYRNLFERVPCGLFRSTLEGRFLEVNPAMADLFGYSSIQEMMTLDIGSAFYHSGEERRQWVEKLLQVGELRNTESHALRKDGSSMVLLENSRVVRDESGKVLFFEGTLTDITDRKLAEDALRESEKKYRLLIETMQDGVYRSSHAGKFLEVNPAMVKILGYDSKKELLAIDIKSQLYFAPENRESAEMKEQLEEMRAFRLRKKDGSEIWVEDHGRYVVDDEGAVLYHEGVLRDITDRKQLEERIRKVRSDLLFAVSHDLKLPLQALNQSQEMLNMLEPGKALARFQEYREIWRRNLQRLERMINNLVDSQHGEEDRFPLLLAPCRLEEMVKRVVEDLTGYILAFQVTFELNLQSVPESSCDEEAMARVVENLLTNAVKFSPKGGKVKVRLGVEGDALRLEVEDQGCGIPKAEQAQLFQPFQRGRSAQQKGIPGTGLGLYVCRRIVEEHGGSISLQSTEGLGTIVTVRLPFIESPTTLPHEG